MDIRKKEDTKRIVGLTSAFIFFSLFIVIMKALLFWFIMIAVISLYILYKNRTKLKKEDIIISVVLSIVVMLSNLFIAIFVFLGYLAATTIMHGVNQKIVLYDSKKDNSVYSLDWWCISDDKYIAW